MRARSALAGALVGSAILIAPSGSPAAVNFGSNLTSEADNISFSCGGGGTCSLWNTALPTENTSNSLIAPSTGVITGFTLKKSPTNWASINLRVVTPLAGTSGVPWSGGAASADVVPTNAAGMESLAARMPVTVGDFVGFDQGAGGGFAALASTSGAPLRSANPSLPPDGSQGSSNLVSPSFELLAQYRLEADADGDGFGDETQDKCPTNAKTQAACAKKCKKKKRKGKRATVSAKKKKCKKRRKKG